MKFITKYRKEILQGLVALAFVAIIYSYGKKFLNWLMEEDDVADTLAQPSQENLSYPRVDYKAMADGLEKSLGAFFGIDQSESLATLEKMNSREDMTQLIIAFGKRDLGAWPFTDEDANLIKWIHGRMWGNDLKKAKEIFARVGYQI